MFPRSPARFAQLVVMLLLVSMILMLIQTSMGGVIGLVSFAVAAAVVISLWTHLKLHQYFFGE